MTAPPTTIHKAGPERRAKLIAAESWTGLDYVETENAGRELCLHFFGRAPEGLTVEDFRLTGGRRIRDLRILSVKLVRPRSQEQDDCVRVRVDRAGDSTEYIIELTEAALGREHLRDGRNIRIDARYAALPIRFPSSPGPSDWAVDCLSPSQNSLAPERARAPDIDYRAKDYASFRQLILGRLAVTMPEWRERHAADIGVTLVELLAHAGDRLSYLQDAIATEAYLMTARRRISLRRHARLVDYRIDEGRNARAWVALDVPSDLAIAARLRFTTEQPSASTSWSRLPGPVFEPVGEMPEDGWQFAQALNELRFYTWDHEEIQLPAGATRATLVDDGGVAALLQRRMARSHGAVLILAEVKGAFSDRAGDADPARRHAVRLTRIEASADPLSTRPDGTVGPQALVEIEWGVEDALPFALQLSNLTGPEDTPACSWIHDIAVAYGNVLLVDEGLSYEAKLDVPKDTWSVIECTCDGAVPERVPAPQSFASILERGPLVYQSRPVASAASAADMLAGDSGPSQPAIVVRERTSGDVVHLWEARDDLLASGPGDRHIAIEIDDERRAHLRFGNGILGRRPEPGSRFDATFRTGGGASGDVGRDTIRRMIVEKDQGLGASIRVNNPLAAVGGREPESAAHIRLMAPHAFRQRRERAVIAEDYAELAEFHPKVQRAAAELVWTGTYDEVRVYIDPLHTTVLDRDLRSEIETYLVPKRRIGHEVRVLPARYVALLLEISIEVQAHHVAAHVAVAVRRALGAGLDEDMRPGLFNPDELTFGEPVRLSRITAKVAGIEGVASVVVNRLERLTPATNCEPMHAPPGGKSPCESAAPEAGILAVGPNEIARLDGDRARPDRGVLIVNARGGR